MKTIVRALAALALFAAGSVAAQGYPQRPIKIIVGAPPGQSVDVCSPRRCRSRSASRS